MSKSNQKSKHQEKSQRNRAALEHTPAPKRKEGITDIGSVLNDKARQALANIRRQSVMTLQGADLYPVVPGTLPALSPTQVDGVDFINLSHQSTSDIGAAIGLGNRSPFRDPITQSDVQSLANYWTYLMDGGGDKTILSKSPSRSVEAQLYTKNFYALFAFAVYCKFTSNEDFRTILTLPELPRFDYFRLDNGARRRLRSTVHIVAIYENLRNSFIDETPFDFFVWLDKDSFVQNEDEIRALTNEEDALALIVRILVDSEAVNREKWQERNKARLAAQASKPRKPEGKPARPAREERQPNQNQGQGKGQQQSHGQGKPKKNQPRNVADILKEQARGQAPVAAPIPDAPLEAPVIPENTTAAPHADTVIPAETLVENAPPLDIPVAPEPEDKKVDGGDGNVVVLNGFSNTSGTGQM